MTSPNEPTLDALLVDDEEPARALLRELLERIAGVRVVGECADGFEAVKQVAALTPDLVFLDIQMPKLDGFEVLELLPPQTAVIFVTAYDQHALRAFEVNAVDYLLKPFSGDRLGEAVRRARERLGQPREFSPEILAASARPEGEWLTRVVIKDGARIQVVPLEKIDYFEAQGDYVAVHSEGRSHLKQQTLTGLEAGLDPARFLRIHRSYIVNLERLAEIEPYGRDSRLAVLVGGARLPISRSGYVRLREVLDEGSR